MDSFREEFFPWLCKIQYQRMKRIKYEKCQLSHLPPWCTSDTVVFRADLSPQTHTLSQGLALRHSTLQTSSNEYAKAATFSPTASPFLKNISLPGPPSDNDSDDDDTVSSSLRVGIVLHRARDGYVARANTLQSFLALNRHVRLWLLQDEFSLILIHICLSFSPKQRTLYPPIPRIDLWSIQRRQFHRIPLSGNLHGSKREPVSRNQLLENIVSLAKW